jgi:hypothetical protein
MTRWLLCDEAARLCAEFEAEIERLGVVRALARSFDHGVGVAAPAAVYSGSGGNS